MKPQSKTDQGSVIVTKTNRFNIINMCHIHSTARGEMNMRAEPLVRIDNLSINYHTPAGEIPAFKEISLPVMEGEFISIVGPSGCGKSTLLNAISGLLEPASGTITISNQRIKGPSSMVGYMPQSDQLFQWRSIWKNVLLGLEVQKKGRPLHRRVCQKSTL